MNPFHALFGFSGRMGRMAYLTNILLSIVVCGFLGAAYIHHAGINFYVPEPLELVMRPHVLIPLGGLAFVLIWTNCAITTKRLHDLGCPGIYIVALWAMMSISAVLAETAEEISWSVGIAALLAHLWLFLWPGTQEPNRYSDEEYDPFARPAPITERLPPQPRAAKHGFGQR